MVYHCLIVCLRAMFVIAPAVTTGFVSAAPPISLHRHPDAGLNRRLAPYRLVKTRWPPVQIIATSGRLRLRDDDLPKGGRYLSKPYAVAELTQTLKELIPG